MVFLVMPFNMYQLRYKPRAFHSPYGVTKPLLPRRIGMCLKRMHNGRGRYPTMFYRKRVFTGYFTETPISMVIYPDGRVEKID
jgi:hypothetical protein